MKSRLGDNIEVMTRENMEVMLTDMGLDSDCIAEGACEVETARNLGVDHVVTGNITAFGAKLVVSIKLHEVKSGQLSATERVSAEDAFELLEQLSAAAAELVSSLDGGGPDIPVAEPQTAPVEAAPTGRETFAGLPSAIGECAVDTDFGYEDEVKMYNCDSMNAYWGSVSFWNMDDAKAKEMIDEMRRIGVAGKKYEELVISIGPGWQVYGEIHRVPGWNANFVAHDGARGIRISLGTVTRTPQQLTKLITQYAGNILSNSGW